MGGEEWSSCRRESEKRPPGDREVSFANRKGKRPTDSIIYDTERDDSNQLSKSLNFKFCCRNSAISWYWYDMILKRGFDLEERKHQYDIGKCMKVNDLLNNGWIFLPLWLPVALKLIVQTLARKLERERKQKPINRILSFSFTKMMMDVMDEISVREKEQNQ